jgi:hypothetical protein
MTNLRHEAEPQIFLHLGVFKTATTFLQSTLRKNQRVLHKQNWHFINFHHKYPGVFRRLKKTRKKNPHELKPGKAMKTVFGEIRSNPQNVFLSSETLLGKMTAQPGGLFTDYARHVALLKSQLEGRTTVVGYCIRDFADYVESSYKFLLRMGAPHDFETYAKSISPENLSWVAILDSLVTAFGPDNVRVWIYEDFKRDSVSALRTIMRAASIDPTDMEVDDEHRNISLRNGTLFLVQQWNQLLRDHRMAKKQRLRLQRELRAMLPEETAVDAHTPLLNARQMKRLHSFYTKEIKKTRAAKSDNDVIARTRTFLKSEHFPNTMPLLTPERRAELSAHYAAELATIRARWPGILVPLAG